MGVAGRVPANLGLTPANSDLVVRDYSQVDRNVFPESGVMKYISENGVNHLQEPMDQLIIGDCEGVLDIRFGGPSATGYFEGGSKCNAGF